MRLSYAVRRATHAGFPDQRTSEIAPSFAEMEARRAAGRLGHYRDGRDGWPGWDDVRLRVYTVEQEVRPPTDAARPDNLCPFQLVPRGGEPDRLPERTSPLLRS